MMRTKIYSLLLDYLKRKYYLKRELYIWILSCSIYNILDDYIRYSDVILELKEMFG